MMPGELELELEVEQYVKEYGEYYRGFIENALKFLNARKLTCDSRQLVDRATYICNLVQFSAGGY